MVLGAACLWGTTGTAQTFSSGDLSAPWFGAFRLAVAALFFAAWAAVVGRAPAATGAVNDRLPLAAVGGAGLCMAVYNLAFFAGVRLTGVGVGTAVALGSGPVWAGLLQAVVTRRAPTPTWWAGTALAVAGGVAMTLGSPGTAVQAGAAGMALCLLAGLSYAVYTLLSKRLVGAGSTPRITLNTFGLAALVALPAAWLQGGSPTVAPVDIVAVAYVGIVTAGVAYLLFTQALRHISAATGVTLALAEPVMAFMLAVMVVGEPGSWISLAGLGAVVAGVWVVVRAELAAPA